MNVAAIAVPTTPTVIDVLMPVKVTEYPEDI
jgi:hypothetical protein